MFCKFCGNEIDRDSIYCSFCGLKQKETSETQNAEPHFTVQPAVKNVDVSSPIFQNQPFPEDSELDNKSLLPSNLLEDIDLIEISLRRPDIINISVLLQVAIIIHDVVTIVWGMSSNTITGSEVFGLLFFSIWRGLLANSIYHRKKRARIIYCVLVLLRIALLFFILGRDARLSSFSIVESFTIAAIDFTASILLFSKSAIRWFDANSKNIL